MNPRKELNNDNYEHDNYAFAVNDHEGRGEVTPNLLLDTGATSHIINDKSRFVDSDPQFNSRDHLIELAVFPAPERDGRKSLAKFIRYGKMLIARGQITKRSRCKTPSWRID